MSFEFGEKARSCYDKGCPMQCIILSAANTAKEHRDMAAHMAEHLVGEDGEHFDRFIADAVGGIVDTVDVEGLQRDVRVAAAKHIDEIEDDISSFQADSDGHALSCDGLLKMRATKDGGTYLVSICTSHRLYMEDHQGHAEVHITRSSG